MLSKHLKTQGKRISTFAGHEDEVLLSRSLQSFTFLRDFHKVYNTGLNF